MCMRTLKFLYVYRVYKSYLKHMYIINFTNNITKHRLSVNSKLD